MCVCLVVVRFVVSVVVVVVVVVVRFVVFVCCLINVHTNIDVILVSKILYFVFG